MNSSSSSTSGDSEDGPYRMPPTPIGKSAPADALSGRPPRHVRPHPSRVVEADSMRTMADHYFLAGQFHQLPEPLRAVIDIVVSGSDVCGRESRQSRDDLLVGPRVLASADVETIFDKSDNGRRKLSHVVFGDPQDHPVRTYRLREQTAKRQIQRAEPGRIGCQRNDQFAGQPMRPAFATEQPAARNEAWAPSRVLNSGDTDLSAARAAPFPGQWPR